MFRIKFCILASALIVSINACALNTDKAEKIIIHADAWTYNYKTGLNIYEGNVTLDQGTTHITADRVVTQSNLAHEIQEATAYGTKQLAHYWTLQQKDKPYMHAYANLIKFYPPTSNIRLEKNVLVTQASNSFRGQLVLYNSLEQTITVPPAKNARATIIYNPSKS